MRGLTVNRLIGSLSSGVFERCKSTGSGLLAFLVNAFVQIFWHTLATRVKALKKTKLVASRHIEREKASLPVDVRCSETPLLKLPN